MTLQIIQTLNSQSDGSWLWSVWIDGEQKELDTVESVRYTLDSSYNNPIRTETDRNSNFRLNEKAYKAFTIYAKITYRGGREEHLQHDLTFAKISVKSESQQSADETWDLQLSLEGNAAELDKIQSVGYNVDYNVDNNVIYKLTSLKKKTKRNQKSGFKSGFKIKDNKSSIITALVDVKFSDKRSFRIEKTLQLWETKREENKEIVKKANELFNSPSSAIIVDQGVSPVSIGLETKGEEITSITDKPITASTPEIAAIETPPALATALTEPSETSAKTTTELPQASSTPPTLMENIQSTVTNLFNYFKKSASPAASSEAAYDITRLLENPLFPSSIEQLRQYVGALKGAHDFALARKLLNVVLQAQVPKWLEQKIWIKQQLALCTYKDKETPPYKRLDEALLHLEEIGLRNPDNKNSETLALGGAIYKRKWRNSGQLEHLHEALFFYLEAYKRNPEQDMGYAGVNAAFILDLLADRLKIIAARSGSKVGEAERLQQEATELRRRMATEIPLLAAKRNATAPAEDYLDRQFWYQVTMAEIHFGLKNYEEAGLWLAKANALNAKEWERETLFNQLTHIARLQGIVCPGESDPQSDWHPAWQALSHILGEHTGRALANGRGKVGLAMSGGGFRASLFHLGVLARLAEMDVLRGVEVLSTVSGGSILGAYYYLEVQNLLQTKSDTELTREDYIALVGRVREQFLEGVQKNIRMRAFSDFRNNLRMLFTKNYTRSHRLGELYESELYGRVKDGHAEGAPRSMSELSIQPKGESDQQSFNPNFSNWRRRAKAPVLLLNSTSLNSGHNWQFTAHWMGEPPGLVGGEIDVNQRYRRVYYKQAPTDDLKKYRLGHAVAASACVPGLFEPLSIDGLFEGRTLRLVDGGVHDNQGVAGLLDEGCTLILCSDACGQMGDLFAPSDDPGTVLLRTTSLLQDRVRESEYLDLRTRLDSRALEGLFFVHTKKELGSVPLDWIGCQDPQSPMPPRDHLTSYDVALDLQEKIAAIRTDLDAFSEVEAYALMASGYLMTKREFNLLQEQHQKAGNPGTWGGYYIDAPSGEWPFRALEPLLKSKPGADKQRTDLEAQLKAASKTFFKTWNLTPVLKLMVVILGVVVILDIDNILIGFQMFANNRLSVGGLIVSFVIFVIVLFFPAFKWLFPQEEGRNSVIKIAISLLGYILSKAHLRIIDRLFLARGKLERLLKL